jgi:hypothetical protein
MLWSLDFFSVITESWVGNAFDTVGSWCSGLLASYRVSFDDMLGDSLDTHLTSNWPSCRLNREEALVGDLMDEALWLLGSSRIPFSMSSSFSLLQLRVDNSEARRALYAGSEG